MKYNINTILIKNFHVFTSKKLNSTLNLNQIKRFFGKTTTKSSSSKEKSISFDLNWKEKYKSNSENQIKNIKKELGEERVLYITEIAKAFSSLNKYQIEELNKRLNNHNSKLKNLSSFDINNTWPKSIDTDTNTDTNSTITDTNSINPNETTTQFSEYSNLMSSFSDWVKSQQGLDFGFGSSSSNKEITNKTDSSNPEKKEEIAEEVKEKQIYDLYLQSFEASKKITVIKTVREITGLGLKEAKELVETCPQKLKDKVKKDEVKGIVDKIEAAGGKVEAK